MRTRQAIVAVLATALAAVALTGCKAQPGSSGSGGIVVERDTYRSRGDRYTVTIREDSGKRDKGMVSRETYERCQVGDRWPDCKRER